MATEVYTGVVEHAGDVFSVYFPDVPGCVSAGATLVEAFANGEQALCAHLHLLAEEGEDLPHPSADVAPDPESHVAALFLARVDLPGKAVRLNITMDEGLVASIDRIARNRSAFLAEAARDKLARERVAA
jgi:predicted RNase H-like HicB family nuclease